jgi:hypothetical protein
VKTVLPRRPALPILNCLLLLSAPACPAIAQSPEAALNAEDLALNITNTGSKGVAAAATIHHTVTLRNVPHRFFDDATPWQGDREALLTAVRALQKAFAERDMKTIEASFRSVYDSTRSWKDFATFDEIMKNLEQSLKTCSVADLPAKLKVESFYEGRLFHVAAEDGAAPVRIVSTLVSDDSGPDFLEIGEFWCYCQGAWLPLGN